MSRAMSPLVAAALSGSCSVARCLLAARAALAPEGRRPLAVAAATGSLEPLGPWDDDSECISQYGWWLKLHIYNLFVHERLHIYWNYIYIIYIYIYIIYIYIFNASNVLLCFYCCLANFGRNTVSQVVPAPSGMPRRAQWRWQCGSFTLMHCSGGRSHGALDIGFRSQGRNKLDQPQGDC